jgi:hypothetical protein
MCHLHQYIVALCLSAAAWLLACTFACLVCDRGNQTSPISNVVLNRGQGMRIALHICGSRRTPSLCRELVTHLHWCLHCQGARTVKLLMPAEA